MASIHITSRGTFAVHYSVEGKQKKKTFATKSEAKHFLALITLSPEKKQSLITASQILEMYRDQVTIKHKGAKPDSLRIGRFLKSPWAPKRVDDITTKEVQDWLTGRYLDKGARAGTSLSDGTVRREGEVLKAAFFWAVKQKLCTSNPFADVELPRQPDHRERTASAEDIEALKVSAGWDAMSPIDNSEQLVLCAFLFACQTGMRSGEILNLEEAWIEDRVIHIPKEATKTDSHRDVAMSLEAMRLLDLARNFSLSPQIFGELISVGTRDALWRKIRDRAGLGATLDSKGRVIREGLNFHDSRATFCTWAASPDPKTKAPRLEVLALARQTGHKNLKMLMKYYRATAASLASRLD